MEQLATESLIDGRYRLIDTLGQGAFARTLHCQDLAEGERPVAVKELILQQVDGWKSVELFQREAAVLATLQHPGVPKIYRSFEGKDAGGRLALYLVLELIDGPSLLTRIQSGQGFSSQELRQLVEGVLQILDYLHARIPPVYHRDIKPSNIVLRSSGAAVLVDFGGVLHGWRPSTGGATVIGTFGYMPPEQLLGQVSPASDLYALGATLLHLVTGKSPDQFSLDAGRLHVPDTSSIDPALRRLINRLLAPAPRDRPASAKAAQEILAGTEQSLALVPYGERAILAGAKEQLQTVDVGPPGRDPDGELHDVYLDLVDPGNYETRRIQSKGVRGLTVVAGWMFSILSLGLFPLLYSRWVKARRAKYEKLFRDGQATVGKLIGINDKEKANVAIYTYEYEAHGQKWRASMDGAFRLRKHWHVGDAVDVLYDATNPAHSCVVFRWKRLPGGKAAG